MWHRTLPRSAAGTTLGSVMRTYSRFNFDPLENCVACTRKSDSFFCCLPSVSLQAFDDLTFTNIYPKGTILMSEGEALHGILHLCQGSVKLSISSDDGKTLITRIAEPGEALGLSAVISGNPSNVTAETLTPSQVNFVRRDDLLRLLSSSPPAAANALRQLAAECEVGTDRARAMELSQSAAAKLASVLLSWSAGHGIPTGVGIRIQVPMTHDDISHLLNTSRETVTRLLHDLRDEQVISMRGSTLIIHDKPWLEALVSLQPR